jgi:hypothetical protein
MFQKVTSVTKTFTIKSVQTMHRSSPWSVVFCSYLEFQTMDKIQKTRHWLRSGKILYTAYEDGSNYTRMRYCLQRRHESYFQYSSLLWIFRRFSILITNQRTYSEARFIPATSHKFIAYCTVRFIKLLHRVTNIGSVCECRLWKST